MAIGGIGRSNPSQGTRDGGMPCGLLEMPDNAVFEADASATFAIGRL